MRYVSCDSESRDERAFCELIESELRMLGLSVWRDNAGEPAGSNGWNVYASLPGEGESILFSSHMDTVTPGKGVRPVVEDGVIRSSGNTILGADDKAGIAAVMEALETIREQKLAHRPIEVLFSICEELGMVGAKHADYSQLKSRQAVVLDGGEMGCLINQGPADIHLHFEIFGKSAHAAIAPEQGAHALKAAAAAIANIPCGRVDDISVMNVADFSSPGASNIVPDRAQFHMEIRSFEEDRLQQHIQRTEQAVREACEAAGTTYALHSWRNSSVLHVPADSPLTARLMQVYRELGVEMRLDRTFGGSDATWLSHNGIDAINIPTGMKDVHSLAEHITVADLELTARAMLAMMMPE